MAETTESEGIAQMAEETSKAIEAAESALTKLRDDACSMAG